MTGKLVNISGLLYEDPLSLIFIIKRKKNKGIPLFVIQADQPERRDVIFPGLLFALSHGFSGIRVVDNLLYGFSPKLIFRTLL